MFCPYCGTESTQGLNYCKRCGGNLAPLAQAQAPETRQATAPPATVWAAGLSTVVLVVMGLGLLFPLMTELAARGVGTTVLICVSVLVALTVFGCAALLLRFWSLLLGVGSRPSTAARPLGRPAAAPTGELGSSRFDALNPSPADSITEQTTRTLEPAKKKY